VKHLFILLISILLLSSPLFGKSKETCYVVVDSSEEFSPTLLSNISVSIISQFLREVEPIPPAGVSMDSCLYQISVSKEQDTTFVTFKGKNLNSYGDSKLSGTDGFQQSLLKSLYRSLSDKRKLICEGYGELIVKCGSVVVQDVPKKVEPVVVEKKVTIPKVEPKVVVEKKVEEPIVVVEKNGKGVLYKSKGNGTWFDKSSTRYKSGYWKKKDGKYVGDVENGKPNGLGILIFPDGRKYVGEYKYGRMDGQGTYTYPDGSKEVGEWKSGKHWNVKGYDKNGNITEKYVNGKWIKQ